MSIADGTTTPMTESASVYVPDEKLSDEQVVAPGDRTIAERRARAFSVTSFILGIVSVAAGWTFFVPIVGLVLGLISLKKPTVDRTLTIWGIVLNGVMLALFALAAIAIMFFIGAGLAMVPFAA